MPDSPRILFLCTGNSCRSQMAEGLCRAELGDRLQVHSAGIETHGLNPYAVAVMREIGLDISGHSSKTVDDLPDVAFDYVVTVCDNAHETCPVFPAKTRLIHQSFPDPPKLARDADTEEERLNAYRRVRNQVREFVRSLPEALRDLP